MKEFVWAAVYFCGGAVVSLGLYACGRKKSANTQSARALRRGKVLKRAARGTQGADIAGSGQHPSRKVGRKRDKGGAA